MNFHEVALPHLKPPLYITCKVTAYLSFLSFYLIVHIQKSIKSQHYCSSDDATDDAGEAAGVGTVAAGFLHTGNIVIGKKFKNF